MRRKSPSRPFLRGGRDISDPEFRRDKSFGAALESVHSDLPVEGSTTEGPR
jgi:hypothetical protein